MRLCFVGIWLLLGNSLYAYDFEVEGIQYEIRSESSVCALNAINYSGDDINIPENVEFDGSIYEVVAIGKSFSAGYYEWDEYILGSIKTLSIPKTVIRIEEDKDYGIFHYFENLEEISVDPENPIYVSKDGVLFFKDYSSLLCYPKCNTRLNYTIPNGVEEIYETAFGSAMYLNHVEMSNSIKFVRQRAFSHCENLKEVNWSSRLEIIERDAFYSTELDKAVLPASLKELSGYAFDTFCTMNIYCEGETPASIIPYKGTYQPFNDETLEDGTLYVPRGAYKKYASSKYWKDFTNIQEYDIPSDGPTTDEIDCTIMYLNIDGNNMTDSTVKLSLPSPEVIKGYTFDKWVVLEGNLEDGIRIQAIYTKDTGNAVNDFSDGSTDSNISTKKIIRKGEILIYKEGKLYNTTGI